jgi:hypothetical protein
LILPKQVAENAHAVHGVGALLMWQNNYYKKIEYVYSANHLKILALIIF